MVMVEDKKAGKVLVQDRLKKWKGISFPGGHVEAFECILDSAIREIKEETGLEIKELKSCGIVHWFNEETHDRYIEFLYKTSVFCGQLLPETEEGTVFWLEVEKLSQMSLSPNFKEYLPMFLNGNFNELFFTHSGDFQSEPFYK